MTGHCCLDDESSSPFAGPRCRARRLSRVKGCRLEDPALIPELAQARPPIGHTSVAPVSRGSAYTRETLSMHGQTDQPQSEQTLHRAEIRTTAHRAGAHWTGKVRRPGPPKRSDLRVYAGAP